MSHLSRSAALGLCSALALSTVTLGTPLSAKAEEEASFGGEAAVQEAQDSAQDLPEQTALLPQDVQAPQAEHSWRYAAGQEGFSSQSNKTSTALSPLDTSRPAPLSRGFHVAKQGNNYIATYGGTTMTVTNAQAFGVDVSQHNGIIDWQKAKADGVDFAILRLGWGALGELSSSGSSTDWAFKTNYAAARDAGINVGIYLYSYAGWKGDQSVGFWEDYARQEADHVLSVLSEMGVAPGDLQYPVYYDLEEAYLESPLLAYNYGTELISNKEFLADIAKIFCDRVSAAGYEVGIYSNLTWWNTYLTDPVFEQWERWVARWPTAGVYGQNSQYQGTHALWQAHSEARVAGIGICDINFDYRTDRASLLEQNAASAVSSHSQSSQDPWSASGSQTQDWSYPTTNDTEQKNSESQQKGAVLRLYDPASGTHFYTANANEATSLVAQGMVSEGVGWISPLRGQSVYRLFNPYNANHYYTQSVVEYHRLVKAGWQGEGKAFNSGGTHPVYCLFNASIAKGAHLYTASKAEREVLKAAGWVDQGVAFFATSVA